MRTFALRPIRAVNIRINYLVVEIEPDPLVVPAIITTAWHGTVLAHRAPARTPFEVRAIPIFVVSNEIWASELPFNDSLVDVLPGQREAESATASLTELDPILAVDLCFVLERVFILLGVLHHYAEALLFELIG
ncbi:MAG: hypothetical protein JOY62_01215 [Acidobacteriaceae bacterium]|nr:hypothetical protein [Acidobacteriaceae bacterium]MBV9778565.1 hypothetical protein [Acidobacteriaceae bacterium]